MVVVAAAGGELARVGQMTMRLRSVRRAPIDTAASRQRRDRAESRTSTTHVQRTLPSNLSTRAAMTRWRPNRLLTTAHHDRHR